ncbi:MAG: hypothetical protein KGN77_02005 [Xanthomonadaceae bacterium]|nr:hypothetical protein [Xanthomonadaceae bacterium]
MKTTLAAAAVLVLAAAASPTDWTGEGARNLPPFTMPGPWTLHFTGSDDTRVLVMSVASNQSTDLAMIHRAGTASSYENRGGTFFLEVNGQGTWHVWVTPGP